MRVRTHAAEKRERLVITAEEDVLSVVDELPRCAIDERGRAATELAARLQHEHAPARLRKRARRRQPCDARTDDDHVKSRGSHCL